MNIQKLAIDTFTSPFANLLAIANLSMVAVMGSIGSGRTDVFGMLVLDLNMPAALASIVLLSSHHANAIIPPMIYLQWMFIAGFAKYLAAELRPPVID